MRKIFLTNENEEQKGAGCYVNSALSCLIVVGITKFFWPSCIPYSFFEFWAFKGTMTEVLKTSWPILLWGVGITSLICFHDQKNPDQKNNAEGYLFIGGGISLWAGIMEEICFRWLIFFGEIVGYKFFNLVCCGLLAWIHLHITGVVANFFTLGYLKPFLLNSENWAVGAAIISSNGKFRDGHGYQGIFGWINSWFGGMFLFYIMFTHGLLAGMFIHFLYDMLIFIVEYIDSVIERRKK